MDISHFDYSDSESWFETKSQREAVLAVIMSLADDKHQEECRYIMRLWAHLAVTNFHYGLHEDLERNVSPTKLKDIEELFRSIKHGSQSIDSWIEKHRHLMPDSE